MIRIDLSNAIPKGVGPYLLGAIPGMLFVASIAAADPQLVSGALAHTERVYRFPSYGLIILALLLCLVVGEVIFLFTWLLATSPGGQDQVASYSRLPDRARNGHSHTATVAPSGDVPGCREALDSPTRLNSRILVLSNPAARSEAMLSVVAQLGRPMFRGNSATR